MSLEHIVTMEMFEKFAYKVLRYFQKQQKIS